MKFFIQITVIFLAVVNVYASWQSAKEYLVGASNSAFGYSVELNDRYAVVGAPYENSPDGAVYIFKREDNNSWTQMQKLQNPSVHLFIGEDPPYFDVKGFGASVDIIKPAITEHPVTFSNNKNIVAIGAPDTYLNNTADGDKNVGVVCMYELNDSLQWEQTQRCMYDGGGNFGVSIALSNYISPGRTRVIYNDELHVNLLVGNPKYSDATYTNMGKVTLYDYNSSSLWSMLDDEINPDPLDDVNYGKSVSAYKGRYVVGSPGYNTRDVDELGSVYIYGAPSNTLSLQQQLTPVQEHNNNGWRFGTSVDIYDDLLIVAMEHLDGAANLGAAYVYVFGEEWDKLAVLQASCIDDEVDSYDMRVVIDENYAVFGLPSVGFDTSEGRDFIGAVSIFKRVNNSYVWIKEKEILGDPPQHFFGYGIGLYENILFLGDVVNNKVIVNEDKPDMNPAIIMYLLN